MEAQPSFAYPRNTSKGFQLSRIQVERPFSSLMNRNASGRDSLFEQTMPMKQSPVQIYSPHHLEQRLFAEILARGCALGDHLNRALAHSRVLLICSANERDPATSPRRNAILPSLREFRQSPVSVLQFSNQPLKASCLTTLEMHRRFR